MKEYVSAELEIIEFSEDDIIQTSLEEGGDSGSVEGGDSSVWSLGGRS